MSLYNRFVSLLRSCQLEQDVEDELHSHLEMHIAENVEAGMSEEDARREATARFGNKVALKENTRAVYIVAWIESVLQDLRFGLRTLRKSPSFSLVAVATVTLSIGISTAVFTIVNSVLLRHLPYPEANRLISATTLDPRTHLPVTPGPDFVAWRDQNTTLAAIAAYNSDDFNFSGVGEPARIPAADVTAGFFSTVGIQPQLGRIFSAAEEEPNGDHVAILTDQFWRERFGKDPNVLDRKMTLEGHLFTIIGVLPSGFRFPDNAIKPSILVPLQYPLSDDQRIIILSVIGRLKEGVTEQQALADLDRISQATLRRYPAKFMGFLAGRSVQITNLHTLLVGDLRKPLLIIMSAVGFVLLIGCLNITSLQLARAVERTPEMEMRSALGAKRGRLTRQLLTENTLLYSLGAALGVCLAFVTVQAVRSAGAKIFPTATTISIDQWALAFAAVVTLLCALLFGLVPALWLNKTRIIRNPGEGRLTTSRGQRRLRKILLVAEVSLALVLLAAAGLMIRSFDRLVRVNAGFNPSHVLTARVTLAETEFPKVEEQITFFDTLLQRVQALPGVDSAALTSTVPLRGEQLMNVGVRIEGEPGATEPKFAPMASLLSISPDYFRALQTPVIAGRGFTDADNKNSIPVAVVNQAFVRKFLHGADPVTRRLLPSARENSTPVSIVGVVADVRDGGLDQDSSVQLYRPYDQASTPAAFGMAILLRSRIDSETLAAAVRREVEALHGGQPVFDVSTMDQLLRESLAQRRLSMMLMACFAGMALLLAAVGIYGVMSYSVAQRSHEIGIRIAVGCSPGRVLRFVLSEATWIIVLGVCSGLAGSLWLTRFIASLLYKTQPFDPLSMISAAVLLAAIGLVAGIVPAYRASRVDPIVALRAE